MKKEQSSAVIVEIRGRYAAALTDKGVFLRIPNEGYALGQQIQPEVATRAAQSVRRRARLSAYAGMAAGFLLLLLGGFKGYTTPVGVVSLDVNPSIEYTINCFDRVLDINAVNDDAGELLAGMDESALLYQSVDEAVDATILALRESGYFSDTAENDVVISASSYDERHTQQISERLGARVGKQGDLTVYSVPVSKQEVQSAHALGTSAGKLHIVEMLGETWSGEESFDRGEWISRPVREIMRETKTQQGGKDDEKKSDQQSSSAPSNTPYNQQGAAPAQPDPQASPAMPEQGNGEPPRQGNPKQGTHTP